MTDYSIQWLDVDIDPERPVRYYYALQHAYRRVVGHARVELAEPNSMWIGNLFVHPDFRNQGIGHQLLDSIEAYATSTNRQFLSLSVKNDNEKAKALYLRYGFRDYAEAQEAYRQLIKTLSY